MKIKPGTIMVQVPENCVSEAHCFVCTGPKPHHGCADDQAGEAFIVGMVEGVLAALVLRPQLRGGRVSLCTHHETMLRELLAMQAQGHPEVFDKLGIEYRIATKDTEVTGG